MDTDFLQYCFSISTKTEDHLFLYLFTVPVPVAKRVISVDGAD
jgi:hypothetical protein